MAVSRSSPRPRPIPGQGRPYSLKFEEIAPLTDAGLTPYRGIKKLRDAGALGPDRVLGVFGIGGLGGYAVQYARLLGGGAKVVAFARNADKLAVAKEYGVDHAIAIKGKSSADIAKELEKATGQPELDAVIDCTGAPEMMQLAFSCSVSAAIMPMWDWSATASTSRCSRGSRASRPFTARTGATTPTSCEVMALAAEGKIRHTVKTIAFDQLNEHMDLLRAGEIVGRAVMTF